MTKVVLIVPVAPDTNAEETSFGIRNTMPTGHNIPPTQRFADWRSP
jgi:hypothetical protein